jgi:hypothetical protein
LPICYGPNGAVGVAWQNYVLRNNALNLRNFALEFYGVGKFYDKAIYELSGFAEWHRNALTYQKLGRKRIWNLIVKKSVELRKRRLDGDFRKRRHGAY